MAKTGPQKYPNASTSYWYQSAYPGTAMESNVGCLHTTEGTSLPSYDGGAIAPNFTAVPDIGGKRLRWYQHFDFDVSSRALRNAAGGVETNTLNCVQVELVGTCDPARRTSWGSRRAGRDYLFWPDAPDWALAELGKFVRWCHDAHGIRMQSTVEWLPYPESYGPSRARLSAAEWRGYYGWLGHAHVVENLHGDPGALDFARVLEHAKGEAAAKTTPEQQQQEEDPMPQYTGLGTEWLSVPPAMWVTPRWTSEWADQPGDHVEGGRVVLHGPAQYAGSVGLRVEGLPAGAALTVATSEVDLDGGEHLRDLATLGTVLGTGGDSYGVVPLDGQLAAGRGLRVRLLHEHDGPLRVRAYLRLHSWGRP